MTSKLFKRVSNKFKQIDGKEDDNKVEGMAIFERFVNENNIFFSKSRDNYFNGVKDIKHLLIVWIQAINVIIIILKHQYLVFFSNDISNAWLSNPYASYRRQDLANQTTLIFAYILFFTGQLIIFYAIYHDVKFIVYMFIYTYKP